MQRQQVPLQEVLARMPTSFPLFSTDWNWPHVSPLDDDRVELLGGGGRQAAQAFHLGVRVAHLDVPVFPD